MRIRISWGRSREKNDVKQTAEAVEAARRERERSEKALRDAQSTLSVLRAMHRRNHIDELLDRVVAQRQRGSTT